MKIRCQACGYNYSYEEMRQIIEQAGGGRPQADLAESAGSCEI